MNLVEITTRVEMQSRPLEGKSVLGSKWAFAARRMDVSYVRQPGAIEWQREFYISPKIFNVFSRDFGRAM